MITINIEIKNRSRLKEFSDKLFSRLEDMMFDIILKVPQKFIPSSVMKWLDSYTDKRIQELKQQSIRQSWENMYLEKALEEIRQIDTEKAPADD
ncbi:MAG: hypothetical protein IJE43_02900 [Alphaproteobacteria bacterium]|nr:hypothetical protein [Alphaproteobacteria bacterium]MBQ6886286.1 hypothetical protein [Lachnospiraceae bacterium]